MFFRKCKQILNWKENSKTMSNQHTRRKFTSTLTFKMLCGLVVLVLLGLAYNFIVAEDDTPLTDEAQEEELQRNADRDTIDIVGDYLWPKAKQSRQDMMTDEQKAAERLRRRMRKSLPVEAFRTITVRLRFLLLHLMQLPLLTLLPGRQLLP